jgi:hypothetical protein
MRNGSFYAAEGKKIMIISPFETTLQEIVKKLEN